MKHLAILAATVLIILMTFVVVQNSSVFGDRRVHKNSFRAAAPRSNHVTTQSVTVLPAPRQMAVQDVTVAPH